MRMVLIGLVAILVLGGGAAGAYFYFGKQAEAAVDPSGAHEAKAEKAEKKGGEHGGGHGGGPAKDAFVNLDPLILPIIDEKGVSQVLSIVVVLEVAEGASAEEVKLMIPRLKDAYIQDMYGVLNPHAALRDGMLQVGMIKERLNEVSQRVMGPDKIRDVLLQVVQQRPM